MPPLGANLPAGTFPMPVWGRQGKPAVYPLAFLVERGRGQAGSPAVAHARPLSPGESWLRLCCPLSPVERGPEKPLPNYLLKAVSPAQMV